MLVFCWLAQWNWIQMESIANCSRSIKFDIYAFFRFICFQIWAILISNLLRRTWKIEFFSKEKCQKLKNLKVFNKLPCHISSYNYKTVAGWRFWLKCYQDVTTIKAEKTSERSTHKCKRWMNCPEFYFVLLIFSKANWSYHFTCKVNDLINEGFFLQVEGF